MYLATTYVNFTKIAEKKKKLAYTRNAKFLEKWPKNLLGERYRKSVGRKVADYGAL